MWHHSVDLFLLVLLFGFQVNIHIEAHYYGYCVANCNGYKNTVSDIDNLCVYVDSNHGRLVSLNYIFQYAEHPMQNVTHGIIAK